MLKNLRKVWSSCNMDGCQKSCKDLCLGKFPMSEDTKGGRGQYHSTQHVSHWKISRYFSGVWECSWVKAGMGLRVSLWTYEAMLSADIPMWKPQHVLLWSSVYLSWRCRDTSFSGEVRDSTVVTRAGALPSIRPSVLSSAMDLSCCQMHGRYQENLLPSNHAMENMVWQGPTHRQTLTPLCPPNLKL